MASVEAVINLALSVDEAYLVRDILAAQELGSGTQDIYDQLAEILKD